MAAEVAAQTPKQHHGQHDGPDAHMQTVKTGQHEEGRTVDAGAQGETHLGVGLVVFHALQDHEQEAQRHGQRQADDQLLTVVLEQSPVGPSHRGAAGEQDERVDGGNAPGAHRFKFAAFLAADMFRAIGGPDILEGVPEVLMCGDTQLRPLTAKPGQRVDTGVKQGAKKGRKKEDFRGDEPDHAHPERDIHLVVVEPLKALANDRSEPDEHHVDDDATADPHHGGADIGSVQIIGKAGQ